MSYWAEVDGEIKKKHDSPSDYARKGFAGVAKSWECPVFGAAVFFDRTVRRWPMGVKWDFGKMSVKAKGITYKAISMTVDKETQLDVPEGKAICYKYRQSLIRL